MQQRSLNCRLCNAISGKRDRVTLRFDSGDTTNDYFDQSTSPWTEAVPPEGEKRVTGVVARTFSRFEFYTVLGGGGKRALRVRKRLVCPTNANRTNKREIVSVLQ